jgi:hypothetical protein
MADRFYGVALGGSLPVHVTEQATTTSAVFELRVNDTAYASRTQLLAAIDAMKAYIQTKETTPIA